MTIVDQIKQLTKQLLPTGRAFKMPPGGDFDKFVDGQTAGNAQAYQDALSIRDSTLPDNANFTADDCTDWEVRLGIVTNPSLYTDTRKAAIIAKWNFPGTIKARQNWRYLQLRLQAAGFNVYVYENRFPDGFGNYVTRSPLVVNGGIGGVPVRYGQARYGQRRYGSRYGKIVVNSLDNSVDLNFDLGGTLAFTFFIGGSTLGSFANVPASREAEFRQLILKTKPDHVGAFLFINYV